MNTTIDFRLLPVATPSLCIPRVFSNIDEKRIRRIFAELNIAEIDRIDFVNKTTEKGEKFNRVFVHFKRWFATPEANMAREKLLNGKEIKIIYDDPWFWKVSAYREASQPDKKPRLPEKKKATIHFDEEATAKPSFSNNSRHSTDLSRYKPRQSRQETAPNRREPVQKRVEDRTPHPNALPMPKLERGVATTYYTPASPLSSPPRKNHSFDVNALFEQEAALIPPVYGVEAFMPILDSITATAIAQKEQQVGVKKRNLRIKKEKKQPLSIEEDSDELLAIVHRPEPATDAEDGEIFEN